MNKQIDLPIMWSIQQASAESGLTEFTIRQAIKAGRIRYIRLGAGKSGKILLNAQSLCDYMSGANNTMEHGNGDLPSNQTVRR